MEKTVYDKLSEKIMVPGSKLIPQLFAMLADEKEAEILLALPGTAAEMAERLSAPVDEMEKKLKEFFLKGLAFKSTKGGQTKYRLDRDLVQFHDATILWPEAPRAYFDLWQRFMEEEWPAYAKMVESVVPRPFTRIIPVEKSLAPRSSVLSSESARRMIDLSEKIAVTKCTCRLIAHKCDRPVEVCLQVDRAADYNIERGTGRQIGKEEAYKILEDSEKAGLIHVTMNRSGDTHFICNCCGCCCIAMPVMIQYGTKMVDPSRYVAQVDQEACVACGTCEERCYFSAIAVDADKGAAVVDPEKCMGCGVCEVTCEPKAITLSPVREAAFIPA